MKHFPFLFVFLFIPFYGLFAKSVDLKTAETVALNSYYENYQNYYKPSKKPEISITGHNSFKENDILVYYIFNTNNNGFVIVSADDIITPVLGYSFQSNYSETNQPPQFISWMKSYSVQISNAISSKLAVSTEISNEWDRLKTNPEKFISKKGVMSVAKLLTTTWDQGSYYNGFCPKDATGPSGRVYAGCVATAMAQVMNYYKYPIHGQSSHGYDSNYGYLYANFDTTTYEWEAMPNHLTTANVPIATLLYHCGISVDMNYSPNGSGAYMYDAGNSLITYFKYSNNLQFASKSSYSTAEWENILITELVNDRPMLYSGHDPNTGAGHAFVCDGYQGTNYFHFNWGWSGYYDGFFYLEKLYPGGSDFTSSQFCIYNITPDTDYPYYCAPTKTITASSGCFDDGSGPLNNYQNNADCNFLIAPLLADHLTITFDYINTDTSNDVITVYDGPNSSSPVLGTYSGTTIPSSVSSTNDTVLIHFSSNDSIVSEGWQISFSSSPLIFCTGTTVLTAPSDTFSDGSGIYPYRSGSNCKWRIQPENATAVTLSFTAFDTKLNKDFVKIYDPAGTKSTLLATFSGSTLPGPITSNSGQMLVIFTSSSAEPFSGWNASYTSLPSGVAETRSLKGISVYPNPASSTVTLSFHSLSDQKIGIELFNSLGQVVYSGSVENAIENVNKTINIQNFSKGIYTVKLDSGVDYYYKKLIIE